MPKIIETPELRLIREAQRQLDLSGYGAMTIRSVAQACGVGVGTVYNYFPSKEALAAACLLQDWKKCVAVIEAVGSTALEPCPVMRCVHDQLLEFSGRHQSLFRDEAAASAFAGSFSRYHALLRSQLAMPLRPFCGDDFTADFMAEALLTWTLAGRSFDEIYGLLRKLL